MAEGHVAFRGVELSAEGVGGIGGGGLAHERARRSSNVTFQSGVSIEHHARSSADTSVTYGSSHEHELHREGGHRVHRHSIASLAGVGRARRGSTAKSDDHGDRLLIVKQGLLSIHAADGKKRTVGGQ